MGKKRTFSCWTKAGIQGGPDWPILSAWDELPFARLQIQPCNKFCEQVSFKKFITGSYLALFINFIIGAVHINCILYTVGITCNCNFKHQLMLTLREMTMNYKFLHLTVPPVSIL